MGIKKNKISILIFLFSFIIINLYLTVSIIKANELNNSFVRLHVVANSNDIDDQLIKLKISEITEDYISNLNLDNKNSNEILNELNTNKENLLNIINEKLLEENTNYTARIQIGKIYYNEKKENQIYSMDKGYYNSIKIILGDGNGKNFWDFIAPNKENLNKLKNYETILPGIYNLSTNNTNQNIIEYKSKILELMKK